MIDPYVWPAPNGFKISMEHPSAPPMDGKAGETTFGATQDRRR